MCAYLCVRTTIDLPDPLFRQAKAFVAERGMTLKAFLTEATRRALSETGRKGRRMERPPIAMLGSRPIPPRSNAELAAILDAEEVLKGR